MPDFPLPLAVIGAGFSGTMTALHLISCMPERRVLLCERGPTFARGAAFSTDEPVHLLNVRASNMSALPEQPNHFADWLGSHPDLAPAHVQATAAGLFVSRAVYAQYLSSLLQDELAGAAGARSLRIVPDEAVSLAPRADRGFDLILASGRSHHVAGAVVAVGNLRGRAEESPGARVHDPWAVRFTDGLVEGRPVVIVGSGLTMVDVVTSLVASGFSGPVLAISRRGLLPQVHVPTAAWALSRLGDGRSRPLSGLLRDLRREAEDARAAGRPWQSVIDAIRPFVSAIWRGFDHAEQRRFMRHLRPWWDVHRHRTAPPVGAQVHELIRGGYPGSPPGASPRSRIWRPAAFSSVGGPAVRLKKARRRPSASSTRPARPP